MSVVPAIAQLESKSRHMHPVRIHAGAAGCGALIDPEEFGELLRRKGFELMEQHRPLPGGKAFWLGVSERSSLPAALS